MTGGRSWSQEGTGRWGCLRNQGRALHAVPKKREETRYAGTWEGDPEGEPPETVLGWTMSVTRANLACSKHAVWEEQTRGKTLVPRESGIESASLIVPWPFGT